MTWTRDHAEALALLAAQVRAETPGARQWPHDGIVRELGKLRHQPLGAVICATIRCAMDPGANRPECISSPGSHWGDTRISTPPRPTPPPEHRCSVCSRSRDTCRGDDHEFVSAAQAIQRAITITSEFAAEVRQQIAAVERPAPVERPRDADERIEVARAALVAANPGLASPPLREPEPGGEVGTGAGEGAPRQDTGSAWVTRSADCPEAPAQAHFPAESEIEEAANA